MSKRPGLPTQPGSFDELYHRLPVIKRRAAAVGVDLYYDVQAEGYAGPDRDRGMFAASLGKLVLAEAIIKEPAVCGGDNLVIMDSDLRDGGGVYDKANMIRQGFVEQSTVNVEQAVFDMLAHSGETAYRVLSQRLAHTIGPGDTVGDALNQRYHDLGYRHTNVMPREEGAEIGSTSPNEVIRQIDAIHDTINDKDQDPDTKRLASTAWIALSMGQTVGNGMRRFNLPEGFDLLSKTGEYNGDPLDSHVYRHEAGHLILPDDNVIKYCFMTRSRSMNSAYKYLNELVLASATNVVAKYSGIPRVRLLGLRGLVGFPISR